jgi:hypothetical protein
MKTRTISTALSLSLLSSLVTLPGLAQASPQPSVRIAQFTSTPQIDSFSVNQVNQLTPGTELVFTLQGTPNGQATFTIGNLATNIPMREIEPGVYQGRYTIRRQDQLSNNVVVRANLSQGGQIASTRLQQPLVTDTGSGNQTSQGLSITSFTVQPVQQLVPGTELNFTLVGTPNAIASFSITGIAPNQPMREVSPGTYQGQYVIRTQDVFPASGANVIGRLRSGQQVVQARLDQNLGAGTGSGTSTGQVPLEILSPQNNSRVSGTVEVRGRSAPNTTVSVNVNAVNSLAGLVGLNRNLLNQTVQTDSQGNFSFSFRPDFAAVRGTRYDISLTAGQGNQNNQRTLVLYQQ